MVFRTRKVLNHLGIDRCIMEKSTKEQIAVAHFDPRVDLLIVQGAVIML